MLRGSGLRKGLQGNESRCVCGVGHIANFQRTIVLADHLTIVVKCQFAGIQLSIEKRKREYLSGSSSTSTCSKMLLTGRNLITTTVIFFLSNDSYSRRSGGNEPAFRGHITGCRATCSVAGEGLDPRHVQTGTSSLEGCSYVLAYCRFRAIGAHVEIISLLVIEAGQGY